MLLWCRLAAPGRQVADTSSCPIENYAEGFETSVLCVVGLVGARRSDGATQAWSNVAGNDGGCPDYVRKSDV